MRRADLFLGTVEDLLACTPVSATEYRVLNGTLLLRKLLLDGQRNLTDQVKVPGDVEEYHVGRVWTVAATQPFSLWASEVSATRWLHELRQSDTYRPNMELESNHWSKDGVEYESVLRVRLDRVGFLDTDVARSGDDSFSVSELIHYAAYVAGGVHAGVAGSAEQRRLDLFINQIRKPGLGYLGDTLRGIS